jgi:hypothetical protein
MYYTLLWQVLRFAGTFTSLSKPGKNIGPKTVCLAIPARFDFSSFKFN